MTPDYPPFRVDPGEDDPGGTLTVSPPRDVVDRRRRAWGPARISLLVLSGFTALLAIGAIGGGATAIVFDHTQRDASGYLMTSSTPYSTSTYALVSASYRGGTSNDLFITRDLLGTVKVHTSSSRPVFVGIGAEPAVNAYLAGVAHAQGARFDSRSADFRIHRGGAPASPPTAQTFWAARLVGSGQRTLTWTPRTGNWRIVLMNADGSRGVTADVSVGARFPRLGTIGIALLGAGILVLLLSCGGFYGAARRR
jgi:hypothetical protein